MRKTLIGLLFAFFLGIFLLVIKVSAQNVTPMTSPDLKTAYNMECVTAAPAPGERAFTSGPPPANAHVLFTGSCGSTNPCDIAICVGSTKCTTGNSAKDIEYFGADYTNSGLPKVTLDSGATSFPPGGPFKDILGRIGNANGHVLYSIYAMSKADLGASGIDANNNTQQLGKAVLVFPAGSQQICRSVYWDPYGRVFDATSLEPLAANTAKVTILDDKGQVVGIPGNNVPIDNLGKYNISVKDDGMYKLDVTPLDGTHQFVSVNPDPRYTALYERIYRAGDPAFQETQANPQRYDIPLKPVGAPLVRPVELVFQNQILVWQNGEQYVKIELRATHPLTLVKVFSDGVQVTDDGNGNALATTTDKDGYWLGVIKKNMLSQNGYSVELDKNPNYYMTASIKNNNSFAFSNIISKLLSLISGSVQAQQTIEINSPTKAPQDKNATVISFDPILSYIEGYAYDNNTGKIIAKAKVNVVLKMNDKTFYTTNADDSGFFTIYQDNLPPLEYYLQFVDPETGVKVTQTTTKFVAANKSYLTSQKINLAQATKNNQPVVNPATGKLNNIVKVTPEAAKDQTTNNTKTLLDINLIMIVVILAVLIIASLGIIVYIKKRT